MGVGMAFVWAPLAATATRNLPPDLAGAGSGVYNATRQVGSVLGSASMAALMTSRISAELPAAAAGAPQGEGSVTKLPEFLHAPFAAAMSQSMLLPAFVALFGVVAALLMIVAVRRPRVDQTAHDVEDSVDGEEHFVDDDEYVEFTIERHELGRPEPTMFGSTEPIPRIAHSPATEPIGFAHNGFHVDHVTRWSPSDGLPTRTDDPDDQAGQGRHSRRGDD
jgi:hypothetical protein